MIEQNLPQITVVMLQRGHIIAYLKDLVLVLFEDFIHQVVEQVKRCSFTNGPVQESTLHSPRLDQKRPEHAYERLYRIDEEFGEIE